jgi:hypothetical protein
MGLLGDKCYRCGKRTRKLFGGLPTCEECELKVKAKGEKLRKCPIDSTLMKKEVVHKVIIDRCKKCGGVWLDGDEIEIMKKAIESGAGDDFFTGLIIGMVIG